MKKLISIVIVCLVTVIAFAQKDVTQFMGIPIDGSESSMRQHLKEKGFKEKKYSNYLEGQFNGEDVELAIVTNRNKVYRIVVIFNTMWDESKIKIHYNNLVKQFKNNNKYVPGYEDQEIPEKEDISYEMLVHHKVYQASFYQKSKKSAYTTGSDKTTEEKVKEVYSVIDSIAAINNTPAKEVEAQKKMLDALASMLDSGMFDDVKEVDYDKSVWFSIHKYDFQEYGLVIYYDNRHNAPNGEDL